MEIDLLEEVYKQEMLAGSRDLLEWTRNSKGVISIKSCYKIKNTRGNLRAPTFWKSNIPPCISFYV